MLRTITLASPAPVNFAPGNPLSVRLSVRIAATGHRSGTARLWLNDAAANARFGATIAGTAATYYLVGSTPATFALRKDTVGSGPRTSVDVTVDRAVGGNPFKPFGTWTIVIH